MMELFDDLESLSRAAAALFARTARQAVESRGRFSVLVSGGETPRRTYELLAEEPYRSGLPWQRVHLFFGDERCVPAGDPRSNARMLRRALVDKVPLAERQIYPIACDSDPHEAARAYETVLRDFFNGELPVFDLAMLGLGDDGHTASLFPCSPVLAEQERWTAVGRRAGEDFRRVTLTAPLLNRSGLVLFLVAGEGKARVLKKLLEGPFDPDLIPAQLIKPVEGEVVWFVDHAAAALLSESTIKG